MGDIQYTKSSTIKRGNIIMKNTLVKIATIGAFIGGLVGYNYANAVGGCTNLLIDKKMLKINLHYGVEIIITNKCDGSKTGRYYFYRQLTHYDYLLRKATRKSGNAEALAVYNIVSKINANGRSFGYTAHLFCDYGYRCSELYRK